MVRRLSSRDALGLDDAPRLAVVGAGGKTTFLMQLAREYTQDVILTTSTHMAVEQAVNADNHFIVHSQAEIEAVFQKGIHGVTLITGDEVGDGRLAGLPMDWLERLANLAEEDNLPVFVEADGARRLPLKAPASHEPAIPSWVREVLVLVGLSVIGEPIDASHVHRPELLAKLTHQEPHSVVTSKTITTLLRDPAGGLKNIPPLARNIALLNQADNGMLQAAGSRIARELMVDYDTAIIASLQDAGEPIKAVYGPTAAIILAAGKSSRFDGGQKVLLDWFGEPFVRQIARTALSADLEPVIVIRWSQFSSRPANLSRAAGGRRENKDWEAGQSTSINTGIRNLPKQVRSAIFLLADQPQVSTTMLAALIEEHRQAASPIVAPLVEDRRANPVLFDRITFKHLLDLQGDTGGRAIFSKFHVNYMPWLDRLMLFDVDTQEDYTRLLSRLWSQI